MNGGQVWVGDDAATYAGASPPPAGSPAWVQEVYSAEDVGDDTPPRGRGRRAVAGLLIALACVWVVAVAVWAARSGVPLELDEVGLLVMVAVPVPVLLGVGWLVAAVSGGHYAERLVGAAGSMRVETEALERTVAALDEVLESRRAAIAEQIRALSAVGDVATARLEAIGSRLSEEVLAADRHARALGDSVGTAETRLAALLAAMPRAEAEVTSLAGKLDAVAIAAGEQVAALDGRLAALAERGREAEVTAGGAAQTLAAHIVRMEATSEAAGARLTAVTEQMAGEVDALLGRAAEAMDGARAGISAQGDAMLAMLGAHQAALDTAARESAEGLAQRIEIVEMVIDRLAKRLAEQRGVSDELARDTESWVARAEERLATLQRDGTARAQALAQSIAALGGSADAMTTALREGDGAALKAISSAETLLIALDSAARELDETLPGALARLDARTDVTRQRIAATKPELMALVGAAESTHAAVDAVAETLEDQRRSADAIAATLVDGLARGRDKVAGLEHSVDAAIERVDGFVESAAPRLVEALLRVKETALSAADKARDTLAEVIPEAAHALEIASEDAFRRAAGAGVQEQVAAVAEVAETAVAAATRAADRLEAQLSRVQEASAALEARVSDAAETERDSFARRASLLIEALNSAAIDINRSLAPDVSDTAWGAYLKGDRGVFTRRAVRLLGGDEQARVSSLCDANPAFREAVNRYIHDFEAMLRIVLAQREGASLGVTLLSSDVGKLYVALAQAIDRLH